MVGDCQRWAASERSLLLTVVGSLDTQRIHMSGEGRRVNSMVETLVNDSLSYLGFSIKNKTPSYLVTVTKRVSITRD